MDDDIFRLASTLLIACLANCPIKVARAADVAFIHDPAAALVSVQPVAGVCPGQDLGPGSDSVQVPADPAENGSSGCR